MQARRSAQGQAKRTNRDHIARAKGRLRYAKAAAGQWIEGCEHFFIVDGLDAAEQGVARGDVEGCFCQEPPCASPPSTFWA